MKTIKVKFVDFWPTFDPQENVLMDVLRRHFDVQLVKNPDFVIYCNFGFAHLDYDVPRLSYASENLRPDFNECDYAIGFDRISFGDRYFRFPNYLFDRQEKVREIQPRRYVASSRKFCNFVYSNANAGPARDEFFRLLNGYKHVDSAGRHLNNTGFSVADKVSFQREFKFSIAFENSSTAGYSTEKIVDAYVAGTIPIYWGDTDIGLDFNPESFVNCHDYSSLEEVVERVIELDNDERAYQKVYETPFLRRPLTGYAFEPGFEEFLVAIFSQDPNRAFRRNREFWGKAYETQRRKFAGYLSRLEKKGWFSLVEHLQMLGIAGFLRALGQKERQRQDESRARRLPTA